jgi:hypothetical protein
LVCSGQFVMRQSPFHIQNCTFDKRAMASALDLDQNRSRSLARRGSVS